VQPATLSFTLASNAIQLHHIASPPLYNAFFQLQVVLVVLLAAFHCTVLNHVIQEAGDQTWAKWGYLSHVGSSNIAFLSSLDLQIDCSQLSSCKLIQVLICSASWLVEYFSQHCFRCVPWYYLFNLFYHPDEYTLICVGLTLCEILLLEYGREAI
jgi:hypothetical protein